MEYLVFYFRKVPLSTNCFGERFFRDNSYTYTTVSFESNTVVLDKAMLQHVQNNAAVLLKQCCSIFL